MDRTKLHQMLDTVLDHIEVADTAANAQVEEVQSATFDWEAFEQLRLLMRKCGSAVVGRVFIRAMEGAGHGEPSPDFFDFEDPKLFNVAAARLMILLVEAFAPFGGLGPFVPAIVRDLRQSIIPNGGTSVFLLAPTRERGKPINQDLKARRERAHVLAVYETAGFLGATIEEAKVHAKWGKSEATWKRMLRSIPNAERDEARGRGAQRKASGG